MAQVCARCHTEFRGAYAFGLYWCTVDRFFVCRRCWEERCGEGHGSGAKNLSFRGISALGFLVMVTVVAAPWAGMVAYDYSTLKEWNAAPIVPVGELRLGQIAKVAGVIVSNSSIVFGGREVDTDGGWVWSWDATGSFAVTDGAGTVFATMERWWEVGPGLHPAPNAVRTSGTVYTSGDRVYMIGNVASRADGTLVFFVRILSPSPADPAPPPILLAFIALLVGPLIPLWLWAGVWWHGRAVLHRRAVNGIPPVRILEGAYRDPSLSWRPNRKSISVRQRRYVTIVLVAIFAALVYLTTFLLNLHERSDEVAPILVISFGGLMLVVLPVLWVLYGGGLPAAVAFSERGFHLWYDNPYERQLNDDFIPWAQIAKIEFRDAGRYEKYWYLERTTGEGEDLDKLSAENLRALTAEWKRRTEHDLQGGQAAVDA